MKATPRAMHWASMWVMLMFLASPLQLYGAWSGTPRLTWLSLVVQSALAGAGLGICIVKSRRIVRAVRVAGGRLCLRCGFDVSGLPTEGVCPECGVAYSHGESIRKWRSMLNDTRGLGGPDGAGSP